MNEIIETLHRAPLSVYFLMFSAFGFIYKIYENGSLLDEGPWTAVFAYTFIISAIRLHRIFPDVAVAVREKEKKRHRLMYGKRHI